MAELAVQTAVKTGVVPTLNAVSASDEFSNDGRTILWVTNGSGGSLTVTIVSQNTIDTDLAIADRTVTLTTGQVKVLGPYATTHYNDADGMCTLQFSATTSVTCAVISVPS